MASAFRGLLADSGQVPVVIPVSRYERKTMKKQTEVAEKGQNM